MFVSHDDWEISGLSVADGTFKISAPSFDGEIAIKPAVIEQDFRVGIERPPGPKLFSLSADEMGRLSKFIEDRRGDHKRLNEKRKQPISFPKRLELSTEKKGVSVSVEGQSGAAIDLLKFIGTAAPKDTLWFSVNDIEKLVLALAKFEVDVTGWFGDTDVADSQLNIIVSLGEDPATADRVHIIIPAVISLKGDYASACQSITER